MQALYLREQGCEDRWLFVDSKQQNVLWMTALFWFNCAADSWLLKGTQCAFYLLEIECGPHTWHNMWSPRLPSHMVPSTDLNPVPVTTITVCNRNVPFVLSVCPQTATDCHNCTAINIMGLVSTICFGKHNWNFSDCWKVKSTLRRPWCHIRAVEVWIYSFAYFGSSYVSVKTFCWF
jgi:hypothetical protein